METLSWIIWVGSVSSQESFQGRKESSSGEGDETTEVGIRIRERFKDAALLAMKMEEGATSQGMWEHLGAGRGKETNLLQSLQKETALLAPWRQPHEPRFGFLTPEL